MTDFSTPRKNRNLGHLPSKSQRERDWFRGSILQLQGDLYNMSVNIVALRKALKVSDAAINKEIDKLTKPKPIPTVSKETKKAVKKALNKD